jgi:hypothetical protein
MLRKISLVTAVAACLFIPASAAFARGGGHGGHGGGWHGHGPYAMRRGGTGYLVTVTGLFAICSSSRATCTETTHAGIRTTPSTANEPTRCGELANACSSLSVGRLRRRGVADRPLCQ